MIDSGSMVASSDVAEVLQSDRGPNPACDKCKGDNKGNEDGQTTACEPHGDPLKVSAAAPTNRSTKLDRGKSEAELV